MTLGGAWKFFLVTLDFSFMLYMETSEPFQTLLQLDPAG